MEKIKKPNYKKSTLAAHKLLEKSKINTFPVPIFDVINQIDNLKVYSFKEMANLLNISEKQVSEEMALSDEGAIGTFGTNKIIILYNSNTDEKMISRIRFTLAHEIGHLILGHPFETDNAVLSRNGITETEDKLFEIEANNFAREFLAPTFIANSIDPLEVNNLVTKFEISKEPSKYLINWITKSRSEKGYYLTNLRIPSSYIGFYKTIKYMNRINYTDQVGFCVKKDSWIFENRILKYCNKCKSIHSYLDSECVKFCVNCRSTDIQMIDEKDYFKFHESEEQNSMSFTKLETDSEGRVLVCPICSNEHVSDNYCSVCGIYIINKCSREYDFNDERETACEGILNGADRFCPKCGCESTFLKYKLLKKWDYFESLEDPFTSKIDISDDDLPF